MIVIFASYLSNVCTATADIFYLNNLLSHIRVMFRNTLTTSHNSTTPQSHNPALTTLPNLSNEANRRRGPPAREASIRHAPGTFSRSHTPPQPAPSPSLRFRIVVPRGAAVRNPKTKTNEGQKRKLRRGRGRIPAGLGHGPPARSPWRQRRPVEAAPFRLSRDDGDGDGDARGRDRGRARRGSAWPS